MTITADEVLDIISTEVPIERSKLDPSATLESIDIASLDMISVMFALEDQHGILIEQEDLTGAKTLQDFIDVVIAKAKGA